MSYESSPSPRIPGSLSSWPSVVTAFGSPILTNFTLPTSLPVESTTVSPIMTLLMGPPSTVSEYISPSGVLSVDIESGSRSLTGEPPLCCPRRLAAGVWTDPPLHRRWSFGAATGHSEVAASYQISRHRPQESGMAGTLAPRCRHQDEGRAQKEHCRYAQSSRRPEEPRLTRRHARL